MESLLITDRRTDHVFNHIKDAGVNLDSSLQILFGWNNHDVECQMHLERCCASFQSKMSRSLFLLWETHQISVGFNSLEPSDAIWRQRTRSTLAQVMACCLPAPSHYLNQCWLIMNLMLWHPPGNNYIEIYQNISSINEFENYNFTIITASPRGQWVKASITNYTYIKRMGYNTHPYQ